MKIEVEGDTAVVLNTYWGDEIQKSFDNFIPNISGELFNSLGQSLCIFPNDFLDTIWEMSLTAFDKPREIQVVIDVNNNLFISVGTPGFVSFMGQEEELHDKEKPMTLPIACWIHTHPFGKAYFSGTDWRTIRNWEMLMDSAVVLGDNQKMLWTKENKQHTLFYQNGQLVVEEE